MRTSTRISLIISGISVFTIIILTILMHFRYHITRMNLINDRINITGSSIYSVIDNNLQTGISIDAQADLQSYIKRAKENIIDHIYILRNKNWNLDTVFKTDSDDVSAFIKERSVEKIKTSKELSWSFNDEHTKDSKNYVGMTVKGPSGTEVAAIVISYKNSILADQEKEEIENLYKRMMLAIIACIIFGFIIGHKTSRTLAATVDSIDVALEQLKNHQETFDLSTINDPVLRGNVRKILNNFTKLYKNLKIIDNLQKTSNKEK